MDIAEKCTDLQSVGAFSGAENFRKSSQSDSDLKKIRVIKS